MKRIRIPRISDRRPIAGAAILLWVALSPWIWGFADSHAAVANHVALVFGFAPLALIMVNLRPAAFATLLGGIWLVASPWALGYATNHTAWLNELASGLALTVLCASAAGIDLLSRFRSRRATKRGRSRPVVADTTGARS
jgi:hypothetical protein